MESKTHITDRLRSVSTVETAESKASRSKRFHVVSDRMFVHGFDTSEEAIACATKSGSDAFIWDVFQEVKHWRRVHHNFRWFPAFGDAK